MIGHNWYGDFRGLFKAHNKYICVAFPSIKNRSHVTLIGLITRILQELNTIMVKILYGDCTDITFNGCMS